MGNSQSCVLRHPPVGAPNVHILHVSVDPGTTQLLVLLVNNDDLRFLEHRAAQCGEKTSERRRPVICRYNDRDLRRVFPPNRSLCRSANELLLLH